VINLTGETIVLRPSPYSEQEVVLVPNEQIARIGSTVSVGTLLIGTANGLSIDVPVIDRRYGTVEGLEAAMIFGPVLVSPDVLLAVPGRENVYAVDPLSAVYGDGRILYYTRLIRA